MQADARGIKNPRSKLRGIGGRKEADQKNAASCGEYVPKEIYADDPSRRRASSSYSFVSQRLAMRQATVKAGLKTFPTS